MVFVAEQLPLVPGTERQIPEGLKPSCAKSLPIYATRSTVHYGALIEMNAVALVRSAASQPK